MPFIQGVLSVHVLSASSLPLQNQGSVDPFGIISRKTLGVNNKLKPYIKIHLDEIHLRSTKDCIHADHQNPQWDQSFTFFLCHEVNNLVFKIHDRNKNLANLNLDNLVDEVQIPVSRILSGKLQPDEWHPLAKGQGQLRLAIVFQNRFVDSNANLSHLNHQLPQNNSIPPYGGPHVPYGAPMLPYGAPVLPYGDNSYGAPMNPYGAPTPPSAVPMPPYGPTMSNGAFAPSAPPQIGFAFGDAPQLYPSLSGMEPAPLAPLPLPQTPQGIAVPKQRDVPSYFPMTQGNWMTFYQDTETPMLPCFNGVPNPNGSQYSPSSAWRDIYNAINNAKEFIFVAGWSVWTELSLIRDNEEWKNASHLGNLLKRKANEGVTVAVIVWDDQSSWNTPYIGDLLEKGMMMTHDEATYKFFNKSDSRVKCFKQSREPKSDLSGNGGGVGGGGILSTLGGGLQSVMGAINKEVAPRLLYTHHQKTVVVDDPNMGQIVAFVGGLDLTQGRFDSPEFPIFKTLRSFHSGDFRNKCYPGVTEETGPREPWHDIHSQLRGPAALQVMENFLERYWRCEGSRDVNDHVTRTIWDALGRFNRPISAPNAWNIQTFRSISTESAKFLKQDRMALLTSHKGELIDDGILRAYVHAIQNAEAFIYIENQYFLGSSYSWSKGVSERATHVIPMEIVQKIVAKIAKGQDFVCYVLIPMFPEGDPNGTAGQEILLYQHRTVDSMYRRITKAIHAHQPTGSRRLATDYLKFFCLAKQECQAETNGVFEGQFAPKAPLDPASNPAVLRKTLRHPVYVHSKMMIVDDDYIIVGSANINQRSMDGNRDSEIAVGAWQPAHQRSGVQLPRGEVATFRMALWAAHTGGFDPVFVDPSTPSCAQKVQEKADAFWAIYQDESLVDKTYPMHLLPYPYMVDSQTGQVSALASPFDCFPDTNAPVIGTNRSNLLPVSVKKKLIA